MIALAISWFPWYARIMRAAVMRVRKELYIDAARAMGVSHAKVISASPSWRRRRSASSDWAPGRRPSNGV
jgi:hypothetical protein